VSGYYNHAVYDSAECLSKQGSRYECMQPEQQASCMTDTCTDERKRITGSLQRPEINTYSRPTPAEVSLSRDR